MFTTLHRICKRLLPNLRQSASPAAVAVRLQWRLIHAELGLAAWTAHVEGPQEAQASDAATLVAAIDLDGAQPPRELARMLAAAHPGHWVVLPLWTSARLEAAGVSPEVALHTVLQTLRQDTPIGAAAPILLTTHSTSNWCRRYALQFGAQTRLGPFSNAAPSAAWLPAWLAPTLG